jgi:iron complex outermembrane receptor protein
VTAVALQDPTRAEEIQVFGPEYVHAYEIGFKGTVLARRLTFAIAGFHNQIKEIQGFGTAVINGSVTGVTENIGEGYSRGVEAEATFRASRMLSFFAGGNYTKAKIDELKTGLVSVIATVPGQRLPFIPEYSFSLGGKAEIPLGNKDWAAFASGSYQYTGKYTTFFQGEEGSGQNPILGGYGIANLALGVRNDRLSLEVRASNLFDKREVISVSPIQSLFTSFGLVLPPGANIDDMQISRPRTVTLTLRANF